MMTMAAAWNKHGGMIITLLAFMAPMACHGGGGGLNLVIHFPILCNGGWVPPIKLGLLTICPQGSKSKTPLPLPSPSPSPTVPVVPPSGAGLYPDYYNSTYSNFSCRKAEDIVREVVAAEIAYQGRGIAAGLIRLHFHDCFVRGCDASVLLTTTASRNNDTELEAGPNKDSLRGMDVIDKAKANLEEVCPGTVSCADILAFAARDAAGIVGDKIGYYKAEGGRWDGRESFGSETDALPGPFSNLADVEAKFAAQGLSAADLVALSGAHSIGKARCMFISSSAGMNQSLIASNNTECKGNLSNRVDQDNKTPDVLDAKYYQNVDDGNALFNSDYALANSTETNDLVQKYREDSGNVWEKAFVESTIKMGRINVKTKGAKDVEIRKKCSTVDNYY